MHTFLPLFQFQSPVLYLGANYRVPQGKDLVATLDQSLKVPCFHVDLFNLGYVSSQFVEILFTARRSLFVVILLQIGLGCIGLVYSHYEGSLQCWV